MEVAGLDCIIVSVYRSSKNGDLEVFLDRLEGLLNFVVFRYKYIFVAGDFNCDPEKSPSDANKLTCIMLSFGLRATVQGKT